MYATARPDDFVSAHWAITISKHICWRVCCHFTSAGYMVELFRMLASELNWQDTDYYFTCMEYSAMIADLQDPAGNCSMSATGD